MMRTILKSLMKPEAYPEPTSGVDMIQTHVSWIFLTDSHAYKVKKPVDFGFLNFSTIDRRRFYCNEEVKYNRRLCPNIYEGVVELRKTCDGAAFHGNGQILDYAVRMKRLPAERMLDRLVVENRISSAEMKTVARSIAEFHRIAPTSPAIARYGQPDSILFNWQENFNQTLPFESSTLPAEEREFLRTWVNEFMDAHEELFRQRVVDGFIRECDGDIHLENICLVDGQVCIFDCIEFSERFRCCDTAADVAFLLMDLDFHARHDLSEEVMGAYLETSGDSGMAALIDFYKIYRAFVRGKVESFHLNDDGFEQRSRDTALERGIRYFRLARGYAERRGLKPTLFITCGLMGSGKSVLAGQLAFELGIALFNSDTVRKQMAAIPVDAPAAAGYGEGIYSTRHNEIVYRELLRLAQAELKAARSVIIDASFMRKSDRVLCRALAARCGADLVILHVSCNEQENRRRLIDRAAMGKSVSDGRLELLTDQRERFQPPEKDEGILIRIDTTNPSTTLTSRIYERLNRHDEPTA